MYTERRVIVDIENKGESRLILSSLLKKIGSRIYAVKIHAVYFHLGQGIMTWLKDSGVERIMGDFKLYDTPDSVRLCAQSLAEAGFDILTVHASGSVEMMRAAQEGFGRGKVIAVTALTSMDDEEAKGTYGAETTLDLVLRLAAKARRAKLTGLVCSAHELVTLTADPANNKFDMFVPGIRFEGSDVHDQKRTGTPEQAIRDGADYLIVGRELTQARHPVDVLDRLDEQIAAGLEARGRKE